MARALVTGGTRGIGAAVAAALRAAGHEVAVSGRLPQVRAPEGCAYVAVDFTDAKALDAFAARAADMELDILVNNAGINRPGLLEDYDPRDFAAIHQVNVVAPFLLCRAVVPGMRRRRYGRIVNITSIWAVVGRPGRSAYAASKSGLVGLSRALALEVAADNVLVNCLSPGITETDLTRQTMGQEAMAEIVLEIPMRRLAKPEEIAQVVRFLASEENSYMTGQHLVVDGGFVSG